MSDMADNDGGAQVASGDNGGGEGFSVPQAYSDRGWASKITSIDDLWKSYDNAQSMIGKRSVPSDDAPDEDWNNFYKSAGRPDDPTGYKFDAIEGLPEGFDLTDFNKQASSILHAAGLNNRQANAVYKAYLAAEMESASKNKEAIANAGADLDKQFDEMTKDLFGDKFDEVSEKLKSAIASKVPEAYAPFLEEMALNNPKHLGVMLAFADGALKDIDSLKAELADVRKKYGAEDSLNSGDQASGQSKEEIVKALNEAKSAANKLEPFSNERKAKETEIEQLRTKLQSLYK